MIAENQDNSSDGGSPHRRHGGRFWRRAIWGVLGGSSAALALFIVAVYVFKLHPDDVAFRQLGQIFADVREIPPPIGDDYLLSEVQVRFCVRESMRLTLMRLRNLSGAQAGFLSLAIDNYNLRCASYRAAENLVARLKSEAAGQVDSLEDKVEERLAAWQSLIDTRPSGSRSDDPVALGIEKLDTRNPSHVRRIQEKLRAADFYRGPVDGLWGPNSRQALAEFKRAAGLGANAEWTLAAQRLLF